LKKVQNITQDSRIHANNPTAISTSLSHVFLTTLILLYSVKNLLENFLASTGPRRPACVSDLNNHSQILRIIHHAFIRIVVTIRKEVSAFKVGHTQSVITLKGVVTRLVKTERFVRPVCVVRPEVTDQREVNRPLFVRTHKLLGGELAGDS
jgi:hypothetical protein